MCLNIASKSYYLFLEEYVSVSKEFTTFSGQKGERVLQIGLREDAGPTFRIHMLRLSAF